jgi:hypothetical protein
VEGVHITVEKINPKKRGGNLNSRAGKKPSGSNGGGDGARRSGGTRDIRQN